MPLSFRPLAAAISHLDVLLDDMDRAWQSLGRPQSIRDHLSLKKQEVQQGRIEGILAFDGPQPAGVGWVDLPHGTYGSILLHTFEAGHRRHLAEACVRSGLLKGRILELTQFCIGDEYRQAFLALGLKEKFRQKMGLRLDNLPPPPDLPPDITLEPLTIEHADQVGQLSFDAHEVSQDLEGYPDFSSPRHRAALERRIFNGLFGEVIGPASLFVRYRGEPAGLCLVAGIPGWGFKRVAWVLDMAVRPDLQGKGLGRRMIQHSLHGMAADDVPLAGLAVTLSNGHAVRLYEKIGFQPVEQFYEFVGP